MKKIILALTVALSVSVSFGQTSWFQRFDSQAAFTAANPSPTIVSYDSIANGRLPTYEYIFPVEGIKMKPNDPTYTETLYINDWSTLLPWKEIAITGKEGMEFNFTTPVNAFWYDFVEPTTPISPSWPAALSQDQVSSSS